MPINAISFTSNETGNRKNDSEKKVVTGGGAIAATASAGRVKAAKSGFDMFASSKQVSQGMRNITNTTKEFQNVANQTKSLWTRVCENAKWAKDAILNFGSKFTNSKFLKPLIESKLFRGCAGFLGYGFGVVTLISGLSDIVNVTTDTAQSHILNNK